MLVHAESHLVADWIEIRGSLKRQIEHFKKQELRALGPETEDLTAEAIERLSRCLAEIEWLLRSVKGDQG